MSTPTTSSLTPAQVAFEAKLETLVREKFHTVAMLEHYVQDIRWVDSDLALIVVRPVRTKDVTDKVNSGTRNRGVYITGSQRTEYGRAFSKFYKVLRARISTDTVSFTVWSGHNLPYNLDKATKSFERLHAKYVAGKTKAVNFVDGADCQLYVMDSTKNKI